MVTLCRALSNSWHWPGNYSFVRYFNLTKMPVFKKKKPHWARLASQNSLADSVKNCGEWQVRIDVYLTRFFFSPRPRRFVGMFNSHCVYFFYIRWTDDSQRAASIHCVSIPQTWHWQSDTYETDVQERERAYQGLNFHSKVPSFTPSRGRHSFSVFRMKRSETDIQCATFVHTLNISRQWKVERHHHPVQML